MLVPLPPEKTFFPRTGMEIPPGISAPTVSLIDLVGSVDAYRTCRSQRRFQGKRILSSYRLCTTISATMQSCLSLFLPTSFRRGGVVRINFFFNSRGRGKIVRERGKASFIGETGTCLTSRSTVINDEPMASVHLRFNNSMTHFRRRMHIVSIRFFHSPS